MVVVTITNHKVHLSSTFCLFANLFAETLHKSLPHFQELEHERNKKMTTWVLSSSCCFGRECGFSKKKTTTKGSEPYGSKPISGKEKKKKPLKPAWSFKF